MKFMGSKNRISKYILSIILKDRKPDQYFIDCFVGGGNLIDKVQGNRIGLDNNKYLIALLEKIKNDPNNLPIIEKEEYHNIKNNMNHYQDWLVGWCAICHSYNGKWFGGFAGEITTIINTKRDYRIEAKKNAIKQSPDLQGIKLINCSYDELEIPKNSIIYADPPYFGATKYKDDFNHQKFWEWCREISNKHQLFISEYNAPDDFKCIWQKEINSSLDKNTGSKKGIEKLFIKK